MSFAFGFTGDDIEDEEDTQEQDVLAAKVSNYKISDPDHQPVETIAPKWHSFEHLLSSLPSQLSYNTITIPSRAGVANKPDALPDPGPRHTRTTIHRRSLFDIRQQLMAEADPSANSDADTLLSGLQNGDLTSGIYEGGFKTWECSLDLASLVSNLDFSQDWHIIELGAGSAVPSLALLRAFLTSRHTRTLKFTLCDYNEAVLRLCTAPNILLNYLQQISQHTAPHNDDEDEEGDLDIEELGDNFVQDAIQDMHSRNLSFDFISGGWGESFLELLQQTDRSVNTLILASETIYSPASIQVFTDTLVQLLRRQTTGGAKAWVAAKKVYFGVGGGVDEFLGEVRSRDAKSTVLLDTKDTGVGRVVLEITV
ncbi:hypothetical protein EDD37DRAFT_647346 [Exophiala viscosa]|uniref:protein-histidine N-methyltransferase n=1 Tax=Exophiala viscosa TaxID=2486360 RepID=A0AAN6E643_9EURO|nr:hypothetical protein EDD36DRAFT_460191 [Exophiala viscosa]KAI1627686.1 hypothetical protein EDD37DRAFT_647346 [Exophiala viscosa]